MDLVKLIKFYLGAKRQFLSLFFIILLKQRQTNADKWKVLKVIQGFYSLCNRSHEPAAGENPQTSRADSVCVCVKTQT